MNKFSLDKIKGKYIVSKKVFLIHINWNNRNTLALNYNTDIFISY